MNYIKIISAIHKNSKKQKQNHEDLRRRHCSTTLKKCKLYWSPSLRQEKAVQNDMDQESDSSGRDKS